MTEEVRNWSGSLRFTPERRVTPSDEREVRSIVKECAHSGRTVRPVGAAHSSTPLFVTDDVVMSLENLEGLESHDTEAGRATVLPGTGLEQAGRLFGEVDLGMLNLGDVDYQAIAGAIGTGTHGTGIGLKNLSATLVGGRLVTGNGEVVAFGEEAGDDADPEFLHAAQVSLGSLGVMTALTLALRPAYNLHRLNWCTHIDWVLENFDELAQRNRHFDFYWYPRSDTAQVRTMNLPGEEPDLVPPGAHLHDDTSGVSYEVIPNDRDLRFEEMEYMLPLHEGLDVFRTVRERVKERHRQRVGWRVLVRTIKGDDALLSPSYRQDTMTIALLQNHELPFEEYFDDLEPMFQEAGGRPHWGKKHSMKAAQLRDRYPQWSVFHKIRQECDPDGVFLNDHLRELLIEDAA